MFAFWKGNRSKASNVKFIAMIDLFAFLLLLLLSLYGLSQEDIDNYKNDLAAREKMIEILNKDKKQSYDQIAILNKDIINLSDKISKLLS